MSAHLSAFTLDALELGALAPPEAQAAEEHLVECARCRADREAAKVARGHFAQYVLPKPLPRRRRPSLSLRAGLWLMVPALAALVLWLRLPVHDDGISEKGGAILRLYARHQGKVAPVRARDRLQPGDEIRFVVDSAHESYLLVASIDGEGKASVYFPFGGAGSAPIAAGHNELPGSIVLDAARGPERVFAILSVDPLQSAPVVRALEDLGRRGPNAIRAARTLPVGGTQLSLAFEKTP